MTYTKYPEDDHHASALRYDGNSAPRVLAAGSGQLASAIEQVARENNVPIVQDRTLSGLLSQVPLGDEIPPLLYVAVATVLAYVFEVEGRTPADIRPIRKA